MPSSSLSLISTVLLILAAAIGGGVLAWRLRQPMIVGYLAGGILVGNLLSQFVDYRLSNAIADVGATLLLFTLGVEFSFYRLRRVLATVSWAAVVQILVCLLLFFFFFLFVRLPFLPAMFLAAAAALSSTAVAVKILGDSGQLNSLHAEIATGWLVIQDLAVIPLVLLLNSLTGAGSVVTIFLGLLKSVLILVSIVYLGRIGVPKLLAIVAGFKNREILLLTTVGLVFLAGLATYALGLSVALGAFLAGLLVAETGQNHAVFAEVRPLRDLFAVVFFVSLGMAVPVISLVPQLPLIFILAIVVIVVKWVVVILLLRFLGYHRQVAFLASLSLVTMSEFGLIIARGQDQSSLLTAITFVTILFGSPLIASGYKLYYALPKFFGRGRKIDQQPAVATPGMAIRDHVVICGFGRVGKYIGRALQMANIPFLVIDYNHHTIKSLQENDIRVVYGDPADKEVLDFAQVDLARALIVAIPDRHTQELVIANALSLNRRLKIICRTHHEEDQRHLKSLGVRTVIQPEFEAAVAIVGKLLADFGADPESISGKVTRLKIEHGIG